MRLVVLRVLRVIYFHYFVKLSFIHSFICDSARDYYAPPTRRGH